MTPTTSEAKRARVVLAGLIFECPFCQEAPDCPLKQVRKLAPRERVTVLKEMSDEDVVAIARHHEDCLRRREAALRNKN